MSTGPPGTSGLRRDSRTRRPCCFRRPSERGAAVSVGHDECRVDGRAGFAAGAGLAGVHPAFDGRGRPLAVLLTLGQRHDSICARPLLERIRVPRAGPGRPRCRPDRVIADKAYSSCGFRAYLRKHGIACTIPEKNDQRRHRHNRGRRRVRPLGFDRQIYRRSNVVECCFNRLKGHRGIATRYEDGLRNRVAAFIAVGRVTVPSWKSLPCHRVAGPPRGLERQGTGRRMRSTTRAPAPTVRPDQPHGRKLRRPHSLRSAAVCGLSCPEKSFPVRFARVTPKRP
ncbi:transposase [Streptomyces griseorubiginosus]|uniref:transposase n=1 Tax=Streptomyces griseorubiginosus TaxID=67304 RepID=UPI00365B5268